MLLSLTNTTEWLKARAISSASCSRAAAIGLHVLAKFVNIVEFLTRDHKRNILGPLAQHTITGWNEQLIGNHIFAKFLKSLFHDLLKFVIRHRTFWKASDYGTYHCIELVRIALFLVSAGCEAKSIQ